MNTFYGGQILEKCRGGLAVVISRDKTLEDTKATYEVFTYDIISPEFIHLTGIRSVSHPVERAYIGISSEISNEIAKRVNNTPIKDMELQSIDSLVVMSFFK
ncbi:MAG: hypothetical protein ACP5N1_03905 [Candidatus Woesearchaeota archaeon]